MDAAVHDEALSRLPQVAGAPYREGVHGPRLAARRGRPLVRVLVRRSERCDSAVRVRDVPRALHAGAAPARGRRRAVRGRPGAHSVRGFGRTWLLAGMVACACKAVPPLELSTDENTSVQIHKEWVRGVLVVDREILSQDFHLSLSLAGVALDNGYHPPC